MRLKLNNDIVFFDVEATGLNVVRDRIIQLAMVKYFASGRDPEEREYLINPGIPISEEAMQVHGITPADVARKPTFLQLSSEILEFFGHADLAGYRSNQYDLPMLMEEFARCGIDFSLEGRRLLDVQRIFYKMEPRTLAAAHRFYCGREMEGAHDAMSDVRATIAVLDGQLEMYEGVEYVDADGNRKPAPVTPDVETLHDFTNDLRFVDVTQKLRYDMNGDIVFNFGKYTGRNVGEVLYNDRQYYQWILNKEFSTQVKQAVKKLLSQSEKEKKGDK